MTADPTLIDEPSCPCCGCPIGDDETLDPEIGLCAECSGLGDAGVTHDS